jgi:lipoyl(octanoyl) transferase
VTRSARVLWLGRRRYAPVLELQKRLHAARRAKVVDDTILLVEHEPVITLGRSAERDNVLLSAERMAELGVDIANIGRGGDVTYHGPGQLVGYPILDLRPERCDVRRYVRMLAEAMIQIAGDFGIEAGAVDGMIGVWADADEPERWAGEAWAGRIAKIGAIGVRLSRWVTMHGFALNVHTSLDAFSMIVPCGIREHAVASLSSLGATVPPVSDLAMQSAPHLAQALEYRLPRVEDWSPAAGAEANDLERVHAALGV